MGSHPEQVIKQLTLHITTGSDGLAVDSQAIGYVTLLRNHQIEQIHHSLNAAQHWLAFTKNTVTFALQSVLFTEVTVSDIREFGITYNPSHTFPKEHADSWTVTDILVTYPASGGTDTLLLASSLPLKRFTADNPTWSVSFA